MASNSFPFPTAPSNFGESVSAQAPGLDPNSNRSTSQSHTVELGHSPLDQQIPQAQDTTLVPTGNIQELNFQADASVSVDRRDTARSDNALGTSYAQASLSPPTLRPRIFRTVSREMSCDTPSDAEVENFLKPSSSRSASRNSAASQSDWMLQLFDRFAERELAREQQVRADARAETDRREREARDSARALAAAELRATVLQLQLQAAHANGPSVSPPPLSTATLSVGNVGLYTPASVQPAHVSSLLTGPPTTLLSPPIMSRPLSSPQPASSVALTSMVWTAVSRHVPIMSHQVTATLPTQSLSSASTAAFTQLTLPSRAPPLAPASSVTTHPMHVDAKPAALQLLPASAVGLQAVATTPPSFLQAPVPKNVAPLVGQDTNTNANVVLPSGVQTQSHDVPLDTTTAPIATTAITSANQPSAVQPCNTVAVNSNSTDSTLAATAPAAASNVVIVRQLQQVRPYSGQTSWRSFRDHFERVCKVNGWNTTSEKTQHLMLSLESSAAEILREIDDTSLTAYDEIWTALKRRFGNVDEVRIAQRRFDKRCQQELESLAEFEQGLRALFSDAYPNASVEHRDASLKRRFEEGVISQKLSQFLRVHARSDNFPTTVERARQFAEAAEDTKAKKTVRIVTAPQHESAIGLPNINALHTSQRDLEPILDEVKKLGDKMLSVLSQQTLLLSRQRTQSPSRPGTPPAFSSAPNRQQAPPSATQPMPRGGRFTPPPNTARPSRPSYANRRSRGCWTCGRPGCHSDFCSQRLQPSQAYQQLILQPAQTPPVQGNSARGLPAGVRTPPSGNRPASH